MGRNATAAEVGQGVDNAVQDVDNAVSYGGKGGSRQTSTRAAEDREEVSSKGGLVKRQEQSLAPSQPSQEEKYRAWEEKARTQLREQMARDRREFSFKNDAGETKELLG